MKTMKHFYLEFTKKRFFHLFLGMSLLLMSLGMMAQKTSVQSGAWTDTATWGGGAVPNTTESVTIAAGHNVTFPLTADTSIGILSIASTASLTVSNNFIFSIGTAISASSSTIAGNLTITGTSSRTIGNLTVTSSGIVSSTGGSTSLGTNTSLPWVNDGTVTLTTLGLIAAKTLNNNGTLTCGFGSGSQGIFNNNSGATLNLTGTVAGYIYNFGTMNSAGLSGTAAVANIYNKASGVLNFTGGSMNAGYLNLYVSESGNTVNYSLANSQTIKLPADGSYSNIIVSNSGNKTIGSQTFTTPVKTETFALSSTLCTGTLTILGTAKPNIANANIRVSKLIFGGVGQLVNTYGSLSSTSATIKNSTYFQGTGSINVTNTFPSWNSAGSGLWSDTTKWSTASVPLSGDAITITQGQPILDVDFASSASIVISSGATLTINEGVFLNNLGTITNNGELLLKSSATGTASLLSSSSVNNVTQQRYLSSNQRGWRLLSNPLASTTFNTLASASNITLGTNFTGEYLSASNTWTNTDGAVAMDTQKAYKVFITGLTGEAPGYPSGISNVNLAIKGTAANTAPAAKVTVAGEYYLVGNPYTAPVSLSSIVTASSGLSNSVAYYNPTIGSGDLKVKAGGYDFPVPVSGAVGSASDVVIPPMGAIFVQATADGSIIIPKTAIFTGIPGQTGTYNHKSAQAKIASTNALKLEVSSEGIYYDVLALQFKTVGDVGSNIDFGKLPNSILDAYSISGTKKMAVSELELAAQTIPLGITSTIQKSYTFNVVENTIPVGFEAVLVDKMLNTDTVLTPGTNYNFAIDSTPASQGDARFAINLRTAGSLGVETNELDAKIQVYPNPSRGQFNIGNALDAAATIEISSLNGQVIHTQKLNSGTTTIQTKSWATGVYILKVTTNGAETTKKLLIQ